MTDKRGVFSISDISDLQLSGSLGINDTWVASSGLDLGYFIGGYPSPNNTLVQRIDYSSDSTNATLRGFLPSALNGADSHGNDNFAYATGCQAPAVSSKVYRLDYFNDGTAPVHKGNMPNAFFGYSAVGNQNYAYFCAGWNQSAARSDINRVDFTNDTATASPKGTLSANKTTTGTGASSNNNYGWVCDGLSSTPASVVDRIDFANDTATASVRGPLARGGTEGISASGNNSYGWYYGGNFAPGGQPNCSLRERIDYSNDTATSTPRGNLSTAMKSTGSHGNQSYGYTAGNGPSAASNIERTDYANDTSTGANVSYLTTTNNNLCGVSGKEDGTNERGITQYPYATGFERAVDTDSQITKSFLNVADGGFGYHTGGIRPYSPANPSVGYNETNTNRIDYSNDTVTTTSKAQVSISPAQMYGAGPLSSPSHGYLVGGGGATYTSWGSPAGGTASTVVSFTSIQRMDYSNDGASFVTMATNISDFATNTFATVSNANYGYLRGGDYTTGSPSYGGFTRAIFRYDFANDNYIQVNESPSETRGGAGFGNQDYGYFSCGGRDNGAAGHSNTLRIDYSNDTSGATDKGNNVRRLARTVGTSNKDYGYLIGGARKNRENGNPAAGPKSTVSRFDFANDTNASVDKGNLPVTIRAGSGSGNANFGYIVGGYHDSGYPLKSSIYRVNYANDTASPVVKGKTADETGYAAGHGAQDYAKPLFSGFGLPYASWPNPNPGYQAAPAYGYTVGGYGVPSFTPAYNIPAQRIDFTNDTATALAKAAPGAPGMYYNGSVGNRDYGYSSRGGNGGSTQRMDYANDSATMVAKAPRTNYMINPSNNSQSGTVGGYNESATGNHDYGYFNGGYKLYSVTSPTGVCPAGYITAYSHIDRIDYSNDTADSLRRSYNTTRTGEGGACGNNNYGYWMAGGANWCNYYNAGTVVERTDYSTDTTNSVVKGNLNTVQYQNRCIGNTNYGWTTGGSNNYSVVERVDYSNDTATASPRGPLSVGRNHHASTGNEDYGYAVSGNATGAETSTDRIDYSNDTGTASPKGNLAFNAQRGDGMSAGENGLPYTV